MSDKGLISRIYKELKKEKRKEIKQPINKWANEIKRHFSNDKVEMANEPMEIKKLNFISHQRDANSNCVKILSYHNPNDSH